MLNSNLMSLPHDLEHCIIPQNQDSEIITIFKYIVSFLSFNSTICGYNF